MPRSNTNSNTNSESIIKELNSLVVKPVYIGEAPSTRTVVTRRALIKSAQKAARNYEQNATAQTRLSGLSPKLHNNY